MEKDAKVTVFARIHYTFQRIKVSVYGTRTRDRRQCFLTINMKLSRKYILLYLGLGANLRKLPPLPSKHVFTHTNTHFPSLHLQLITA